MELSKEFWEKSVKKHQKLHGKLSQYAVLAIQTVSTAFYV